MGARGKQQRRLIAATLLEQDQMSDAQIGEVLGVTDHAVNNWRRTWGQGGTDALMSKGRTGSQGYRTPEFSCFAREQANAGPECFRGGMTSS
ncbi:helix-turn-helix domain-containing protein [Nocardiopsis algeriensis]|uniref:Transposase n=1 Tax=Nocardiopsis algeriensis TaxID=1478215 RepID=A0A841IS54_9ACTN|nr:helix-turn-helix domain-containing protein [Nocardiopsis algeriensis]MBB6119445.1 transposase [Nocardiopsis algeriensis]